MSFSDRILPEGLSEEHRTATDLLQKATFERGVEVDQGDQTSPHQGVPSLTCRSKKGPQWSGPAWRLPFPQMMSRAKTSHSSQRHGRVCDPGGSGLTALASQVPLDAAQPHITDEFPIGRMAKILVHPLEDAGCSGIDLPELGTKTTIRLNSAVGKIVSNS